jgi:hypothetical protein
MGLFTAMIQAKFSFANDWYQPIFKQQSAFEPTQI